MDEGTEEIDSVELLRQRVFAGAVSCLAVFGGIMLGFISLIGVIATLGYSARAFYALGRFVGANNDGATFIAVSATVALVACGVVCAVLAAGVVYDKVRAAMFGEEFVRRDHARCNQCGIYASLKAPRYDNNYRTCPSCNYGVLQ